MKNIERIREMDSDEMVKLLNGNKCSMCTYNTTNCLKEFCSIGIEEWLNKECELTIDDINSDFDNFCSGKSCDACVYRTSTCEFDYIIDNFNIINGKITRKSK